MYEKAQPYLCLPLIEPSWTISCCLFSFYCCGYSEQKKKIYLTHESPTRRWTDGRTDRRPTQKDENLCGKPCPMKNKTNTKSRLFQLRKSERKRRRKKRRKRATHFFFFVFAQVVNPVSHETKAFGTVGNLGLSCRSRMSAMKIEKKSRYIAPVGSFSCFMRSALLLVLFVLSDGWSIRTKKKGNWELSARVEDSITFLAELSTPLILLPSFPFVSWSLLTHFCRN